MAVVTRRRGVRVLVLVASAVPLVLAGGAALLTVLLGGTCSGGGGVGDAPSAAATRDIPGAFLRIYEQVGARYKLPWEILAGIGREECDRGRDPDPSCTPQPGATGPGVANFAGASGPMRIGIGGAAGDEYDALRHDLPDPSLGPHTIRRRRSSWRRSCGGRYAGPFAEDDLEVGAPFNNFYEETKHLAEVDVRRRMAAGLPATIYRPSVVVGDSRTGETQKFDGPYFVIQWLLRQRTYAVLPMAGDPTMTRVNVVPRDFVVDAVDHLSGHPNSEGRTYHIADPQPLTVAEMTDVLAEATGRKLTTVPLPRSVAKGALAHVAGVYGLMRIPLEAVDYFAHPTHYLTDHLRADLAGSGIEPPAFPTYVRLAGLVHAGAPGSQLGGDDLATPGAGV